MPSARETSSSADRSKLDNIGQHVTDLRAIMAGDMRISKDQADRLATFATLRQTVYLAVFVQGHSVRCTYVMLWVT